MIYGERDKRNSDCDGRKPLRVLVVDDEHAILRVIARFLRSFDTTSVDRVEIAVALLANESFDVVISDNSMPGKTGVDLLRFVAENNPRVRRVMHSGAKPEGFEDLQRDGVVELFIAKPGYADLVEFCERVASGAE